MGPIMRELKELEELREIEKSLEEMRTELVKAEGTIDQATKNLKSTVIFCLGIMGLGVGGLLGIATGHHEAKKATDKCVKEKITIPENRDMDELAQSIRTCVEEELAGKNKTN